PADVRAAGQRGDLGPLARELLRVVLAEVGRAGRRGLEHGARRVPLADRDDRDVTGGAPGALACGVDARTDLTPALGDRHAGVPAVKRADGAPTDASAARTSTSGSPMTLVTEPRTSRTSAAPIPCTA